MDAQRAAIKSKEVLQKHCK